MNNLLSNAIKFTAEGYIKLSVHCLHKSADALNATFIVEDTGIGINKDNLDRIFESFTQIYHDSTRNQVGTGLGLTICAKLLELMDSKLNVKSEINQGSTFSFDLTLKCICTKEHAIKNANKEPEDLSGVKVLVVEDNQINMMIAKKMLDGFNADTTPAYNGLEALDKIDGDTVYDIILMDLEMPVLDGYTAIYDIRRHSPHIPVIAFTASLIDHKMLADLRKSGFTDCLLKPFQPHQLFAIIKKYVKSGLNADA
jgi:CheY-like chemotaxis protein